MKKNIELEGKIEIIRIQVVELAELKKFIRTEKSEMEEYDVFNQL